MNLINKINELRNDEQLALRTKFGKDVFVEAVKFGYPTTRVKIEDHGTFALYDEWNGVFIKKVGK